MLFSSVTYITLPWIISVFEVLVSSFELVVLSFLGWNQAIF